MSPNWPHPIWDAYRLHGDAERLREEILTTSWYHNPSKLDESLLLRAVEYGDLAATKVLIEVGESPALPAGDGFSLLHIAVDFSREKDESPEALELIATLLHHGANPNEQGMDGTPLHRAAGSGLTAAVDILLQHGANLEARMLVDGELTPLMHAAMMNQPPMVSHLLSRGADATSRCASYMGNLTTEELVERKGHEGATEILRILRG